MQSEVIHAVESEASASAVPELPALALPVIPSLVHLEQVVEQQAKLLQEKDQQIHKLETTVESLQKTLANLNRRFSAWQTQLQPVIDQYSKTEEF